MNSNASFGVKDWKYKTLTISNLQVEAQSDFYTNNVQNDFHAFSGLSRKCKPVFQSPTKLPQIYIFNRGILNSQTLEN